MKFFFGNYDPCIMFQAKSLELAIKLFKVEVLFPEKYVAEKFVKKKNYDMDFNKYHYKFKKNPKIFVYAAGKDGYKSKKVVTELLLDDCIHVDYSEFMPKRTLLGAPSIDEESTEPEVTLPVVGSHSVLQQCNKVELRQKHNELEIKMNELDLIRGELNSSMKLIKKELKEKGKMVYMIETYMGINEEVIQLQEGKKAPEDIIPLTLYQQVLYMDEEMGIWEDGGIDWKNIEEFDEWVCKHLDKFLNKPKSVCVFQVRRNPKNYSPSAFDNALLNQGNFNTYFLIRNGENIYRIWSDVSIGKRLFPKTDEYEKLNEGTFGGKEEVQKAHEKYLYGLIAIQGLLERTDILGTSLREVNLLKPRGFTEEQVELVRDGEREFWLTNNRLEWQDFISKNRSTIKQGTRIICTSKFYKFHGAHDYDSDNWRTEPFIVGHGPSTSELYEVVLEVEKDKSYYRGHFKIFFRDTDLWKERKRRVPFLLNRDEVINFDEITVEECDYYARNRLERENYLDVLPILHWVKNKKLEEQKLEAGFIRFIADQLGWSKKKYPVIQKAIDWWKLKNKWKRGLMKDDAKAVRMILARLKKDVLASERG